MKEQKLFMPIKIGKMKLKNRLIMAPMATNFATSDGSVTDRILNYYSERAKGGVGLIISESCYVSNNGKGSLNRLGINKDEHIDGLKILTKIVHDYDVKIAAELHHAGAQSPVEIINENPISAWNESYSEKDIPPRTMTEEEINDIVKAFADAANRAVKANFDAILIHAGHGYLLNHFLSPCVNHRKDAYGGNKEKRLKILLEIIKAIRQNVGNYFPIIVRLNGKDYIKGGLTLSETKEIALKLEKASVDCLNITAGTHTSMEMMVQPMVLPRGCLVPLAAEIKKTVSIPVAVVGRINNPQLAERILTQGKADLITIGRALIADPYFPQKILQGKSSDIRPCIACNQGCNWHLYQQKKITCFVNPSVGKEKEYKLEQTKNRKNILVAGGGPAGLEFAMVAALRGHNIILYEKNGYTGGQLKLAAIPPYKQEMLEFIKYLERKVRNLGVKVELNKQVDSKIINLINPDILVVATGAKPIKPSSIGGCELPHVYTAHDILDSQNIIKGRVVIIGGGGTGIETAEYLIEKGCKVTIIELLDKIACDMEPTRRKLILKRLSQHGVKILLAAKVECITNYEIQFIWNGNNSSIKTDYVIFAVGVEPRRDINISKNTRNTISEIYYIGDCVEPKTGLDAVNEGFNLGVKI
jgi:2,4-dienoyl-CoA reductase-like NADH-dependent reductase (Old Yellow Enzyme family)/thioredoxin reductase